MLAGYFDESERRDGAEPVCVAGYVFTSGRYARFAREWRKFLRSARHGGLTHLHMTDLYAGQGEYRGLGDAREDVFCRAVEIINEHMLVGVAVLFEQADFEATAPAWYASVQGSIYTSACQICLRATSVWLEDHGHQALVAYTFETGHRFEHEANAVLRVVAGMNGVADTHRYRSHTFGDKKRLAGLQAADVLAWTIARAHVGFPSNRTIDLLRPHMLALASDSSRYQVQMFTDTKLARFFAEQADKPADLYFSKPPEMRNRLR